MTIVIPFPAPVVSPTLTMELAVNRKNTAAFILADPQQVTMDRKTRVSTNTGGWKDGPPAFTSPQVVRVIPSSRQLPDRQTADGVMATPSHTLLVRWDGDVKRFDEFNCQEHHYIVLYVWEKKTYEIKAELLRVSDV